MASSSLSLQKHDGMHTSSSSSSSSSPSSSFQERRSYGNRDRRYPSNANVKLNDGGNKQFSPKRYHCDTAPFPPFRPNNTTHLILQPHDIHDMKVSLRAFIEKLYTQHAASVPVASRSTDIMCCYMHKLVLLLAESITLNAKSSLSDLVQNMWVTLNKMCVSLVGASKCLVHSPQQGPCPTRCITDHRKTNTCFRISSCSTSACHLKVAFLHASLEALGVDISSSSPATERNPFLTLTTTASEKTTSSTLSSGVSKGIGWNFSRLLSAEKNALWDLLCHLETRHTAPCSGWRPTCAAASATFNVAVEDFKAVHHHLYQCLPVLCRISQNNVGNDFSLRVAPSVVSK